MKFLFFLTEGKCAVFIDQLISPFRPFEVIGSLFLNGFLLMAHKKKSHVSSLWGDIKSIIYIVVFVLIFRMFTYEPFNIPSGSMIPTLLVGDYLFVSKFSYGYSTYSLSVPFAGAPDWFEGRVLPGTPERGDVAVFKLPTDNSTDYIKRVIGLPGDRIQMIQGVLHINGVPVTMKVVNQAYSYREREGGAVRTGTLYEETLPEGKTYITLHTGDMNSFYNNTPEYKVPEGSYFMMGDNRDDSQDSRFQPVGPVPFKNLVGRANVLFFSVDGSQTELWEVWKWPEAIRYNRIFQAVR